MDNTGICHVTLTGNVVVKLRFGLPACRMFSEMVLDANPDIIENNSITELGIAKLLHFGYKNECSVTEQPGQYRFSDFVDYVEDQIMQEDKSEMMNALECFYNSRTVTKFLDNVNTVTENVAEEGKKKLIGRKSNHLPSTSLNSVKKNSKNVHIESTYLGGKVMKGKTKRK